MPREKDFVRRGTGKLRQQRAWNHYRRYGRAAQVDFSPRRQAHLGRTHDWRKRDGANTHRLGCDGDGGTLDTFIELVFNYPALSETYKYAAYDGLGNLAGHKLREG